jgi:hypothetical protein
VICPHCKREVEKTFSRQVTCGSKECQLLSKREDRRRWYREKKKEGVKLSDNYSKKIEDEKEKDTVCLKCNKKFVSVNGYRICPKCTELNKKVKKRNNLDWGIYY